MSNYHSTDSSSGDESVSDSEYSYQHNYDEEALQSISTSKGMSTTVKYVIVSTIAAAATIFLVVAKGGSSVSDFIYSNAKSSTFSASSSSSSGKFDIEVAFENPDYGSLLSLDLLPWDAIAEPARIQKMYISKFEISGKSVDLNDYDVTWSIGDDISYTGSTVDNFQIDDVGIYSATVTLTPSTSSRRRLLKRPSTSTSFSKDFTLAVKYVRREIRSLTDDDRNRFLDTLYSMYTVPGPDGRAKYGAKYKDAQEILYRHLYGAARTDCDHWHDGAGLITHHMAYTLEVEQSLQTIDPSISMPYWEYGMDSYHWWESPIFGADWFGEANPSTADHSIDDGGRWAGLELPSGDAYSDWSIKDTGSLNPFNNAFGVMRGPWNNNPSPKLGRRNTTYGVTLYPSMPSCDLLYACFSADSQANINDCLNGDTHGPVHINIGGSWEEGDIFDDGVVKGIKNADKVLFFKILWRMGFTRCPTSCAAGSSHEDCRCAVPDEYIEQYGAESILKTSKVWYPLSSYLTGASDAVMLQYLRAVEDPGVTGEMFSSAASYDPTFWPLHGQMERMLSLKRIYLSQGKLPNFDATWDWPGYNPYSGAAYLYGDCDWSDVSSAADLTLPTCEMAVTCDGHNEDDLLEFSDFQGRGESYSNADMFAFLHPYNESLPYLYDTYDFDYCADAGYVFDENASSTRSTHDKLGTRDAAPLSHASPM